MWGEEKREREREGEGEGEGGREKECMKDWGSGERVVCEKM